MTSGRTLHPEDTVARYRVVAPLGIGGMGEVYLAQDRSLDRNVALKILPPELVRDEERVRRFVLEAKSASSLSHPNIVTIYEIGQDMIRSGQEGTDSPRGPIQFISMELIQGKTLTTLIHEDRTDLRTLLGYLAQAAEGVAKAHGAGIVHRDLKPGNIMVSSDGFAKVLDFGLAKLTENTLPDVGSTSAPTRAEVTGAGLVLGTAGYMSPEQVRGLPVDPRSDVFSFGCVLYEAVTRQRPFLADSAVETMHRILHDKPAPIEERNPGCPAELRRLIRRCLAKSPDQRVQSMKDLAIELREVVDEWESLSTGSGPTMAASAATGRRRRTGVLASLAGVAVLGVAAAGAVWMAGRGDAAPRRETLPVLRLSTQTNRGDVTEAAISSDGRYLAYLTGEAGRSSVRVRQVATGSDLEVVPSEEGLFEGLSFSPDGNYLFYRRRRTDLPSYSALMRVASLGGESREVAFDVDSRATFSPDGTQVAFKRGFPQRQRTALVVRELETGAERELAVLPEQHEMPGAPAWSPDGLRIAVLDTFSSGGSYATALALFDVTDGKRNDLDVVKGSFHDSIAWLPDGTGIVRAGFDFGRSMARQITIVDYPSAEVHRVTGDANDYFHVSISSDDAIAAVRHTLRSNLWIVDPAGGDPTPVTTFSSAESPAVGTDYCEDGSMVFGAARDDTVRIWSVGPGEGEPRPLTEASAVSVNPRCVPGGVIFDRFERDGTVHVWRVDAAGTNAGPFVREMHAQLISVARNGSIATFRRPEDQSLWVIPLDGGPPRKLRDDDRGGGVSPDGAWVTLFELKEDAEGLVRTTLGVARSDGTGQAQRLAIPERVNQTFWSADSRSMLYLDPGDPAWNVARASLEGTPPERVTRFEEGRITQLAPSPDGERLALVRKIGEDTNVWLTRSDGSQPVQVTRFPGEEVLGIRWKPDGTRLLVAAGRRSSDAVLIRGYRDGGR